MGIRFYCPQCARRMNVKSFLAGKRGICPHCDARWMVPLESEIPEGAPKIRPDSQTNPSAAQAVGSGPTASAGTESPDPATINPAATDPTQINPTPQDPTTANPAPVAAQGPVSEVPQPAPQDPIDAAPDAVWYVRPASGGEFGPARGDVMRRWMEEGRVGADSMVWCEGWADWRTAGPIFPSLTPAPEQPAESTVAPVTVNEPKTLANLESRQKKTVELNGRAGRGRSVGSGKSIAAVVILGLMIVALFVVLIVVVQN